MKKFMQPTLVVAFLLIGFSSFSQVSDELTNVWEPRPPQTTMEKLKAEGYNFVPYGEALVIKKMTFDTTETYEPVRLDHEKRMVLIGENLLFPQPAGKASDWVISFHTNITPIMERGIAIPGFRYCLITNYQGQTYYVESISPCTVVPCPEQHLHNPWRRLLKDVLDHEDEIDY